MTSGKGSKLLRYLEHRIRVTLSDGRTMIGTFLAFDKHLNLVLSDTDEFRTLRNSDKGNAGAERIVEERQEKRSLGLIILRGETVISIAVEGPPVVADKRPRLVVPGAPGVAKGAGRGMMAPPPPPQPHGAAVGVGMGLGAGPVHGVGGMAPPGVGAPLPPGMGRGMPPPGMGRGMPPPPPGGGY